MLVIIGINYIFKKAHSCSTLRTFLWTLQSKSLWRSHAVGDFYGTGIEIWAGFGPVGNTEKKKFGPIMSNF